MAEFFQPYDQGKDAVGHGHEESPNPNARLYFPWSNGGGPFVNLWVYDVQTSFGLSGSTAQSSKSRSFFARNSIPPTFTIACQAPNQYVYGRITEFIRKSQRGFADLAYLHIEGGGLPAGNHMRGPHKPLSAEGFVQNVRRRHAKFEIVPDFTFSFVTALMHSPWNDEAYEPKEMLSWQDVVEKIKANDKNMGFAQDPDQRPTIHTPAPNVPDVTKKVDL
jgi:hypothetical protein